MAFLLNNLDGIPMIPTVLVDVYKFRKMRMKKNTPESYLIEIKAKYAVEKIEEYAYYLAKPTPASLYNLCKILDNEKMSKIDKDILSKFYAIEKFDIDKFRPICNFFKGKTEIPQPSVVDVMALLVDFPSRPLGKYLKSEVENPVYEIEKEENVDTIPEGNIIKKEGKDNQHLNNIISLEKNGISKKAIIGVLLFIGIAITVYFASQKSDCMQWNRDHYDQIDCNTTSNEKMGFMLSNPVIKKNQDLLNNFKKIKISDTTSFFNKDGSPKVWYGKSFDNHFECFTMPGLHPETGETLKKITQYIIDKHLLKE